MPSAIEATGRTISAWHDGTTWIIGVDVASPSEWDPASHTFRNLAAGWGWNGSTLHTAFKKSPWVGRVAGSRMIGLCGSNGSGGIMERLDADDSSDLLSTTYYGQADEGGGSDPRTAGPRLGCFVGDATFIAVTRTAAPARGIVRQDSVGGSLTAWAFASSRNWTALYPSPTGWSAIYGTADGTVAAADGVFILTGLASGSATVTRIDDTGVNAPTLADVRDVWAASVGGIDYIYVVVGNNTDRGVWECAITEDPTTGGFNAATDITWRQVFTVDDASDRPQSISGHVLSGTVRAVLGLYDGNATATGSYTESSGITSTYRRTHYRCLDLRAGTPSWEVISNAANVNVNTYDVNIREHPHVITLIGEPAVERGRLGGSNHQVQGVVVAEAPNGDIECVSVGKTTPWICNPFDTVPVWRPFSLGLGALAGNYQALLAKEAGIGWMGLGDDDRGGYHVDHGSPPRFVWCLANDSSGIPGTNNATYSICASYLGLYDAAGGLLYGARESSGYRVAFPFGGATATGVPTFVGVGAQESTTTGTPMTPAYPTGVLDGDYCIVRMSNRNTTGAFDNPGSGVWTLLNNRTQGTNIETVWYGCYYETGQAEPLVDHDNLSTASCEVFAIRGMAPGSPFDIASVDEALAASATFTPAEATTLTPDALVVVSVASADQNALSVGGTGSFTGAASGASYDATGVSSAVAYKSVASPGAAGTVTFTQSINGNDPWTGVTYVFKAGGSETGQNTTLVKDYATIFAGSEFNCIGFFDAPDSGGQLRYYGVDAGRGIIRSAAGGGSPDTIVEAFTTNSNRSIFLRNGSGTYWIHVPGLGIYRSTDYGASWDLWWDKSISDPQDRWSGHMTHNPAIPNTLYVTFDSGGGVWTVPNAHTASAGSGTAGSVPTGATRITGGSLPAGTERCGPVCVDPISGTVWVIEQPTTAQGRSAVHYLPRASGSTWKQEVAPEVEEGGHLSQHLDVYAGLSVLPTSGQGVLRRVP